MTGYRSHTKDLAVGSHGMASQSAGFIAAWGGAKVASADVRQGPQGCV